MLKTLLTSLFLLAATPAMADISLEALNTQIEKTNVVVGQGCSGTIIDKEKRIVLTAAHCISGQFVDEEVTEVDEKTGEIRTKKIRKSLPVTISVHLHKDYETISTMTYLTKIVASDKVNDVAILQVVDETWKPEMEAKLAKDTYKMIRGQKVYVIGNPFIVFDYSMSEGIISAGERKLNIDGVDMKLFQVSNDINGGNSGGSVVNMDGELIGTVTASIRGMGLGFAIPVSASKELLRKNNLGSVLE